MAKYNDCSIIDNFLLHQEDAIEFLQYLDDSSIDCLVTDPPYESLEKHRKVGATTRLTNDWFEIFPNSRFEEFFREAYRVLKDDTHLYVMCDQETMFAIKSIGEDAGFKFWKPIVWDKVAIGMGYHYRARYEFILFFEKGKRKLNDLGVPDVLSYKRVYNGYPTEKPVELMEVLIKQSTNENEVVCDPFMGSGSTAIAALQNRRCFFGNDLSSESLDVTKGRISQLNMKKHLSDSELFGEFRSCCANKKWPQAFQVALKMGDEYNQIARRYLITSRSFDHNKVLRDVTAQAKWRSAQPMMNKQGGNSLWVSEHEDWEVLYKGEVILSHEDIDILHYKHFFSILLGWDILWKIEKLTRDIEPGLSDKYWPHLNAKLLWLNGELTTEELTDHNWQGWETLGEDVYRQNKFEDVHDELVELVKSFVRAVSPDSTAGASSARVNYNKACKLFTEYFLRETMDIWFKGEKRKVEK